MKKQVTMDQIAASLGVSKNAVSLALRGMPGVGGELRNAVQNAARELGYRYQGEAREDGSFSRNVCILVSDKVHKGGGFFDQILSGIERAAREQGCTCNVFWRDTLEDPQQLPLCILSGQSGGIICVGGFSRDCVSALSQTGLPVVLADHYFEDLRLPCVLTDNVGGACSMTLWLLGQTDGFVGFVGDIGYSPSFFDRWLGYVKAHRALGREIDETFVLDDPEKAHGLQRLPSTFFCCNDNTAMLLYKKLAELGVSIPSQVSVAGFDDMPLAACLYPELTTMRVDKQLLGRKAFLRLLRAISDPADPADATLASTELVVRDSVVQKQ